MRLPRRNSTLAIRAIASVLVSVLSLSGCGKSNTGGVPSSGTFADASTVQQLEAEELSNYGINPPVVDTSSFEQQLLDTKPLTFAIYTQAMQATVKCAQQAEPGLIVTLVPGATVPYLYDLETSYAGPPVTAPASQVLGTCAAKYSAAVEANWEIQNRVSGSQLVTQRQGFLSCVIAAGVNIAPNATFAQIHETFSHPGFAAGLTPAQQNQAQQCIRQYSAFLTSL